MFINPVTQLPAEKPTHFIVASMGTVGDMHPFLGVALALQERGHHVTFCGPHIHERHVREAGISFHALGTSEQYLAIIDNPDLWHSIKGVGIVLSSIAYGMLPLIDFMKTLPRERRYVVLAHPLALLAMDIVRTQCLDMKIAAAYLAPSNMRTLHDPLTIGPLRIPAWLPRLLRQWIWNGVDAGIVNPAALPGLNAVRKEHGLPPVRDFIKHMHGIADLSLTLFPAWFAKSQPDWPQPMHCGDFQLYDSAPVQQLPSALAGFLDAGEAPVVFTPGTGNRHASAFFSLALKICRHLGRRAIFLTPFREQVPENLPKTVLWQAYLPFRALLPKAAAIVHHGGIGTTAEALRAGTPQLVIPLAHDQFDNGVRVQALGAGEILSASRLRPRPFLRKLEAVLASETIRSQCRQVAGHFAGERNNDALCQALESLQEKR